MCVVESRRGRALSSGCSIINKREASTYAKAHAQSDSLFVQVDRWAHRREDTRIAGTLAHHHWAQIWKTANSAIGLSQRRFHLRDHRLIWRSAPASRVVFQSPESPRGDHSGEECSGAGESRTSESGEEAQPVGALAGSGSRVRELPEAHQPRYPDGDPTPHRPTRRDEASIIIPHLPAMRACMVFLLLALPGLLYRSPDLLCPQWHLHVPNATRPQRITHRVHDSRWSPRPTRP